MRFYRLPLALIGLWTLIDAHSLTGALIPVVLLALAPPRWWAAALAGFFGLAAGADAVYYGRPLGYVAFAAGLALFGFAGVWFWRTNRRVLKGFAAVFALLFAVFPMCVGWVETHVGRKSDRIVGASVRFGDGQHGSFTPSRNGAAVIVIGREPHARMLARHGYGVLLIDRRGDGRSHGQPNAMGWGNRQDVKAAVDWLHARGIEHVGGLGLSVGGEVMLETPELDAVVSEGAGARSLREEMQVDMPALERPLSALQYGFRDLAVMVSTGRTPPKPLSKIVPRSRRPTLLIAAPNTENGERANRRFKAPLWEIPESGHIQGLKTRPQEYERRVVGFFDQAL